MATPVQTKTSKTATAKMLITKADLVRQLKNQGYSIRQIAKLQNLKRVTVRKYLSKEHALKGQCLLKARYSSAELAKTEALRKCITQMLEVSIYHCPHCDGYHLTSHKTWFENL